MKVLVAGSRGAIGQILVDRLVRDGHEVTGMVRTPSQMEEIQKTGGHAIVADVTCDDTLPGVVNGQDAVIFAAGSKGKALDAVDRDGAIKLCDAARQAGVRRFVLLSSIYAGRPDQGPDNLRQYLHAKQVADNHVQKNGRDYTILRPGFLSDEPGTGLIQIGYCFDGPEAKISRADVAELIAISLVEPATIGKTFEVIGGSTPIADALKQLCD